MKNNNEGVKMPQSTHTIRIYICMHTHSHTLLITDRLIVAEQELDKNCVCVSA